MDYNNSMTLDMDAFDFSMVMDDEDATRVEITPSSNKLTGNNADLDTLQDDDEYFDDDTEEEEEDGEEYVDYEEDADDLEDAIRKVNEDHAAYSAKFSEIADDTEFTIDNIKMTKGQIREIVGMNEDVRRSKEILSAYESKIIDIEKGRIGKLEAARWETQDMIDQFEKALQNPNITGDQYRQVSKELNNYYSKRNTLQQVAEQAEQHYESVKHEAAMHRISATTEVMSREFPDYITKVGPETFKYALESGITAEQLHSSISPALVRALIKAKELDELKARSRNKSKEIAAPAVVRSTKSKATKGKPNGTGRKITKSQAEALKRFNQTGDFQGRDSSILFDMIQD